MADFPHLLKEAATTFTNEATAYAQIRSEGNQVKVRMQSLELARQFVGDVTYGRDPKGILFYNDELDFQIPNAQFKYYKKGSGNVVTIDIYFYEIDDPTPYARFIARVASNQVPNITYGENNGGWTEFRAGSAQTRIIRSAGSNRLKMLFPALRKKAYFQTTKTSRINRVGILLFKNMENLQDMVNGEQCVADVKPDVILFHVKGAPNMDIGLLIPAGLLDIGGGGNTRPNVTWRRHDPYAAEEDEDEEDEDEKLVDETA